MRGKGEGCLATEMQAIMGPCEARSGPYNAKQSANLYNVYYKCPPQAILFRNGGYFAFIPDF